MVCLICRRAELVQGLASMDLERGEIRLKILNVPALVCPTCRDAVLGEDVADHLLDAVEEMCAAGMIEGARNFQEL